MADREIYIYGLGGEAHELLKRLVAHCAGIGQVNVYIHEWTEGRLWYKKWNLKVDVWADNKGSVAAICDQLLIPISRNPQWYFMQDRAREYTNGVTNWYEAENRVGYKFH